MAPVPSSSRLSSSSGAISWRPTKMMNVGDLSNDDDFLSHLLVEKLGPGHVPLNVHKMNSSKRLPKTNSEDILNIVQRLVSSKGTLQQSVRHAVDELLTLPPIRYYLRSYTQQQVNAFATHASRYFELYHPSGCIEIAHTSRYSHHTGKAELCILATRNLAPGTVVTELKGSMANLTDEEDRELKRTDLRNSDIRRDFSVIHSKSMKKNHLFLGPARFVNHDCHNNCELFREGRYITFRVLRPIAIGEEITAHYGDGYFGKKNRHCLCETCEKKGRGGYSPDHQEDEVESSSDSSSGSDSDSDSDTSSSDTESDVPKPVLNVNERRTRRGVYAVTKDDSDDSDEEEDEDVPNMKDTPNDREIELTAELDTGSDLTSLAPSLPPSDDASPGKLSTPDLMTPSRLLRSSSSLSELTTSTARSTPKSATSTPRRSVISTRRQKAKEQEVAKSASRKPSVEPFPKRLTRSVSSLMLAEKKKKGKGKATPTPIPTPKSGSGRASKGPATKIKKEEANARGLRGKISSAVPEVAKEPVPKPDVPRGPDGKPLPTCSTCSNVLPLISVDSQVVWGLEVETSKKKKNEKQDCPRCIRHFAIYSQPWPSRVAPRGTVSVVEREDSVPVETLTKKVTQKGLKVLDCKLAAAAKMKGKKRIRAEEDEEDEEEEEEEARPSKRRKSMPEPAVHQAKVVKTYSSTARKSRRVRSPSPDPVEDDSARRRRGRPRLSLPEKLDNMQVKVEEDAGDISRSILSQPRSTNGRFGKKDKGSKKSHSRTRSGQSKSTSGSTDRQDDSDREDESSQLWTSPRRKRTRDAMEEDEESPRKRNTTTDTFDVDASTSLPSHVATQKRVMPRPMSGFRGGRLFSNPNPLQYARHAWKGPVVLDDSSSEDEKHPDTPEDNESVTVGIITPDEEPITLTKPVASMVPRAPLTFKPSPHALAKRIWSNPTSILNLGVETQVLNIPETHSSDEDEEIPYRAPLYKTPRYSPTSESSDDVVPPPRLQNIYPVVPPSTAVNGYFPKSSHFPSTSSQTKPNFINAGWDSSSDTSEA